MAQPCTDRAYTERIYALVLSEVRSPYGARRPVVSHAETRRGLPLPCVPIGSDVQSGRPEDGAGRPGQEGGGLGPLLRRLLIPQRAAAACPRPPPRGGVPP